MNLFERNDLVCRSGSSLVAISEQIFLDLLHTFTNLVYCGIRAFSYMSETNKMMIGFYKLLNHA